MGDPQAATHAIFWGDSHAYHLISFMDSLGRDYGLSIHDVTHTMCPPMSDGPARAGTPFHQTQRENCLKHNRLVMDHVLSHPDITVVIM
ncbi:SGNH hydrolase domain-containing protein, partial [Acinetobacter baumannii]